MCTYLYLYLINCDFITIRTLHVVIFNFLLLSERNNIRFWYNIFYKYLCVFIYFNLSNYSYNNNRYSLKCWLYFFFKLVVGIFFNQGRKTTLHRRIFVFKPVCFLKKNSEKMIIVTYHIVNVGHSPPPKLKVCVGGWVGDYYVIYYRIQVDLIVNGTVSFNRIKEMPIYNQWKKIVRTLNISM